MNKKKTLLLFLLMPIYMAFSTELTNEQIDEISRLLELESVTVEAIRADDQTPVSFSNMSQAEIQRLNNATNIPVLLQLMPSVVAFTENGTAMGNTSFRIRGVDASRINVTLNGLPLNNPASQEVFWVNLPNLAGFLNSVQIQRGVGTSTTGSAAFGASINLETSTVSPQPTLDFSTTFGSFNTLATNVSASSGLLRNGLFFEGNFSQLSSEGYVRNGFSNHHSAYFSVGLVRPRHFLRFNYLYGNQITGITWRGATEEQIARCRRYNQDGFMFSDNLGNAIYFDNETDNYRSHILQAFYTFRLSDHLRINAGFNYTHGFGYYETFRANRRFREFFSNQQEQTVDGVTHIRSDVIRRQYMRNDFYATNVNFLYTRNNLNVTVGGHYNFYDGVHFGRLPWVRYNENISPNQDWYRNYIQQSETSVFAKFNYTFFNRFNAFVDLQYRFLTIDMHGTYHEQTWRNLQNELDFSETFSFFNPKFGLSFQPNRYQRIFVSVAQSSRTPTRADFRNEFVVASEWGSEGITPMRPERLINFEIGYQINRDRWAFGSNIYVMNYRDQLMPNGRTSESGSALMDNVDRSYRLGLELTGGFRFNNMFRLDGNLTLSRNRIQDYTVVRDLFDNSTNWLPAGRDTVTYRNVNLAYSPSVVGAAILTFTPIENLNIMLTGKYVGRQYFDNFSTRKNRLPAYFVSNLSVRYEFPLGGRDGRTFFVQAFVNNLFNADYISNAYSWSNFFRDEPTFTERRFFVQAPIHFSVKLGFRL
ncbi:MAG: TonB-dependent receptor [Bacteroidales bacterium]|nr:TonB-dependent receptor [Bacteroidales bacterium]